MGCRIRRTLNNTFTIQIHDHGTWEDVLTCDSYVDAELMIMEAELEVIAPMKDDHEEWTQELLDETEQSIKRGNEMLKRHNLTDVSY